MKQNENIKTSIMRISGIIVFLCFMLVPNLVKAQNGDKIIGNWVTKEGDRKINIYKQEGKYFGKIFWVKQQEKQNEVGKVVMMNLEYVNGDFDNGVFILPSDKHFADCAADFIDGGVLELTIYHELKLLGHSLYLTKIK